MKARLTLCATLLLLFWLCAHLPAYGQWKELPATGAPPNRLADRTTLAGQAGMGPMLIIKLVNPKANSPNYKAVIEVETDGLKLVDPVADHEPKLGEAYIQYRLDNGPIQSTTSKIWTFEHLSPGEHLIRAALATSDGHQLGREKSVKVKVP